VEEGRIAGRPTEPIWLYDAYGNLLNDGTSTYVYDAENRLISVTAAGSTTSYQYNGDGDRISQTVDSTLTTYVLDVATPLTMVLSETSNGSTLTYWHGLDVLAQSDGTNTKYFEYDGLGSVRQLTNPSGVVGLSQTFDPYGNPYTSSGLATTHLGFTGEAADSNGFVFLRARYYNPSQGRFFQTDPSRQEQNAFAYAMGNPVMFTDPSGLCSNCGIVSPTNITEVAALLSDIGVTIDCNYQYIQAPETCCGPDATDWFMRTVNSGLQYYGSDDVPTRVLDLTAQVLSLLPYKPPVLNGLLSANFLSRLTRFMTYGLAVRFVNIDYYSMASPSGNFLSTPNDKPQMVTLCGECMRSDDFGNVMFGIGGHNLGIPFDVVTALTMGFNLHSQDVAGANPGGPEVQGVWAGYMYASLFGPSSNPQNFCSKLKMISYLFGWHDSRGWPPSTVQAKTPCATCTLNNAPIPVTNWNGYVYASPVTPRKQRGFATPLDEFINTVTTGFER